MLRTQTESLPRTGLRERTMRSDQNLFHNAGGELVGEPFVATVVRIDKIAVVHPELMKDGRVQVMDADAVLDSLVADFVGGPENGAAFNARSR